VKKQELLEKRNKSAKTAIKTPSETTSWVFGSKNTFLVLKKIRIDWRLEFSTFAHFYSLFSTFIHFFHFFSLSISEKNFIHASGAHKLRLAAFLHQESLWNSKSAGVPICRLAEISISSVIPCGLANPRVYRFVD